MNNFDLRKYLAEGRLKVNEDHTLAREIDSRFGGDPYVDMWGGKHGTITFKTNSEFEDEEWAKVLNFVKSKGFEITDESNYYDFEPNEREWFPKIDFTSNTTSTPVTNEGKSAKELETHIAALSKARAQAASSGKTTLLNSLHRDISKAQKELKKLSTKVEEKRPDYPDVDKDGDTEESMEKALKDRETSTVTNEATAEDAEEANIGLDDLQDIGYDDGEYAFDKHFNKSQLNNRLDTKYYTRGFVQAITDSAESLRLNEEEPLEEALNPEVVKRVDAFIKKLASKEHGYDYSEQDAVFAIQAALKQRGYDNVNEAQIDEGQVLKGIVDGKPFYIIQHEGQEMRIKGGDWPNFKEMIQLKESLAEDLDIGHQDNEPGMLKAELYHIGSYAMELYKMMDALEGQGEVDFPAWWQSKITTAKTMISGAKHYLEFELKEPAIDDMVDRLDGIAPEMEIDVVDDENMEESIDKEFHSTSNTNGHPNWKDLSAVEIQDYIDANPRTLWGRELRTAKMVIDQLKDTAVTEDTSLNDEAKAYFMGKVKRGEIDKLPEDPKAAFLAQMTKDEMDHDRETLDREGGLGESSFYTKDIKDKVVSKLMDQLKK